MAEVCDRCLNECEESNEENCLLVLERDEDTESEDEGG